MFSLHPSFISSVVIASKNCHHTEQAFLQKKHTNLNVMSAAPEPSSLSDWQEDTYVHENILRVAVRVGIPEALRGYPG